MKEICSKFKGTYEQEYRMGTELSFNDRFTRVLKDRMVIYNFTILYYFGLFFNLKQYLLDFLFYKPWC